MQDYRFEKMMRAVQKPGRYIGGENGAIYKDLADVKLRFAMCFPDVYEVGMSHLGLKILYHVQNRVSGVWCERAFAPWFDMRDEMRKYDVPLYSLESHTPLCDFDIVGFTLQYEMSFTNVLYMLDMGRIPVWSKDRGEGDPIVVAGGPCACNGEPIADFIDLFILGEGEEVNVELCELFMKAKEERLTREQTLLRATQLEGIYVPAFYDVKYKEDGTIASVAPNRADVPAVVRKRIIKDLSGVDYPDSVPVPLIETIHDRANIEVLRGCIRGCRFCQAGFIYRPFRAKDAATLDAQARRLCEATGYDELSLISLSTSDHPEIEPLLDKLLDWTTEERINLSLPSLRIDNFSDALVQKTTKVRKSGLTFAPEAGTQRLRDVINKNITEEEVMRGCRVAFEAGYTTVKLYFMMGLPTETDEDVAGIAALAQKIVDLYYSLPTKPKGKSVSVSISCACFIPKPFTPFQFCAQDTLADFDRKQQLLKDTVKSRKISFKRHDASMGAVEAVLARGDRRVAKAIYDVYTDGGIFDSWDDGFSMERWQNAFAKNGIDPAFYANRMRAFDEINPWDMFDYGVDKAFLVREYNKAIGETVTPNCSVSCSACGITKMYGRPCFADC